MTCPHCNDTGLHDRDVHNAFGELIGTGAFCDCDVGEAMRDEDWEMNAPGWRGKRGANER